MAPPKGKGGTQERFETRTVLQAVLLADSFTQRFRPTTVEKPKALLPLVNVPMIEYALEWLAMSKVEEVLVFCCAHADQITRYLADSKWASSREMTVTPVVSTSCLSAGEALRLIEQRDVIKSDFVLISGDTVANFALAPVLAAHRARREADKNTIFTMIMKPIQNPQQRLRMGDTETVVCVDPVTSRLLKYHEADSSGKPSNSLKLDAAFFSERDLVQVRTDLMDTHIAICAPEVLMLFSDNFDYQNVKRDFVTGVLSEEELGNKLYIHELSQGEYAAHIHNLRSYDAVSRDILQRWCFPLAPDTNVLYRGRPWGPTTYRYGRGNRYYEQQVSIPRTAQIGEDVCIGTATVIGENSRVSQSVVGRNCRIGRNVNIVGSYIQDDVTIQDGVVLRHSMVCERAVIQANAVVEAGAIISYGVVIGADHHVPGNARISLCSQIHQEVNTSDDELEYTANSSLGSKQAGTTATTLIAAARQAAPHGKAAAQQASDDDDDGYSDSGLATSLEKPADAAVKVAQALAMGQSVDADNLAAAKFDAAVVGKGGAGYQWGEAEGFDLKRFSLARPSIADQSAMEDEAAAAVEEGNPAGGRGNASGSDDEEDEEDLDPEAVFKREVSETFLRCVKMRFDQTNAIIELNGLKIAENRTFADCARYIFTTMLAMCLAAPAWVKDEYAPLFKPKGSAPGSKAELLKAFGVQLTEWGPLLQRFLRSHDDQVELLLTFEEYCSSEGVFDGQQEQGAAYGDMFELVLKLLYDRDVLAEEAMLAWADEKEQGDEDDKKYVHKASKLLEWLRTADEDDDDDDDEDDSEDDDDDDEE